jgi:uncharacterized protein
MFPSRGPQILAGSVSHWPILSDGLSLRRLNAIRMEAPMHRMLPLLSLLFLASTNACADPVRDLYNAETVVTGKEEPERTRGFRVGLVDVVVKLTGDVRLAESQKLAPLLEKPHPLVEYFEYEDRMKHLPVRDEQGTRERPHFLRMRFNAVELDKALAHLGLSKWADDRPSLAVWVGVKTAVGGFVVTASGGEAYGQRIVITETAQNRGIPVRLPSDQAVTFADISEDKFEKIKSASKEADAWLSGMLSITGSGYWDITWKLRWKDQSRVWTQQGVSFDTALKDGLQTAALIFSGNMGM